MVIEDFAMKTLSVIDSDFGRLLYLSSLKDPKTGRYEHAGLEKIYGEVSVQCALEQCHAEMFTRILETPLEEQETDLQRCLSATGTVRIAPMESWGGSSFLESLCPGGMPNYLNDLFRSNLNALVTSSSNKPR